MSNGVFHHVWNSATIHDMVNYVCSGQGCGLPVPEQRADRRGGVLLSAPGVDPGDDTRYCSAKCAHRAAVAGILRRVRCIQCGTAFDRPAGAGRPADYCSPGCAQARARQVARAWKTLGKDRATVPKLPSGHTDSKGWRKHVAEVEALADDMAVLGATLKSKRRKGQAIDPLVADSIRARRDALIEAHQQATKMLERAAADELVRRNRATQNEQVMKMSAGQEQQLQAAIEQGSAES